MRVRHLAIVFVGTDEEAMYGVNALGEKYAARSETQSVTAIGYQLHDHSRVMRKPFKLLNGSPPGAVAHQVGAYFIFHYGMETEGRYTPESYKGKSGPHSDGEYMAKLFMNSVYGSLKFTSVGKLCLLACKATKPEASGAAYFAEYFSTHLAKLCVGAEVDPPLVAGWDSFVTVAAPANDFNKRWSGPFRSPKDAGRKVAVGRGGGSDYQWGSEVRSLHKWVWVWDKSEGKVIKKRVADSNWSDKMNAQQTPDLHTALTPVSLLGGDSAMEASLNDQIL